MSENTTRPEFFDAPFLDQLQPGTRVNRLTILEQVGEGGMGKAFAAYDALLDRRVCIKFLKQADGDNAIEGPTLLDEARTLAKFSHPGILPVFDVGEFEGRVYLVSEFVDGWTLRDWTAHEKPDSQSILNAYCAAGTALFAAHKAGFVHRDFKPDNVMIDAEQRVRVMDFGIARHSASAHSAGAHYGSPAYMAPELLTGGRATESSDQYAFALSLVESLSQQIVSAEGFDAVLQASNVSEKIKRALLRALNADPNQRFESMAALLAQLSPTARQSVKHRMILTGALASLLAAAGFVYWQQMHYVDPCGGSQAQFDALWNPNIASAIELQFKSTTSPVSDASLQLIGNQLNQYSKEWVQSRRNACEATIVTQEQSAQMLDRRMLCFDRRKREVGAALKVFQLADTKTVSETGDILSSIDSVSRCDNLEAMASLRIPTVAENDKTEYNAIDETVALAIAQFEAGKYDTAIENATAAHARAETLGHGGLLARANYALGLTVETADRTEQAEAALIKSFQQSIAIGDDHQTGKALARLLFIASSKMFNSEKAQQWIDWKIQLSDLFESDNKLAAELEQEHGLALEPLGKLEEAELVLRRATKAYQASYGASAAQTLRAQANYAFVKMMQGDMQGGAAEIRRLLPKFEAAMGANHPRLSAMLGNLAVAETTLGEYDNAEKHALQALEIAVANYGEEHTDVAKSRLVYAENLFNTKKYPQAIEQALRVDGVFERLLGVSHAWRLVPIYYVSASTHELGESQKALSILDEAIALSDSPAQLLPSQQATMWVLRAKLLKRLKRFEESRIDQQRVRVLLPALGDAADSYTEQLNELAEK